MKMGLKKWLENVVGGARQANSSKDTPPPKTPEQEDKKLIYVSTKEDLLITYKGDVTDKSYRYLVGFSKEEWDNFKPEFRTKYIENIPILNIMGSWKLPGFRGNMGYDCSVTSIREEEK